MKHRGNRHQHRPAPTPLVTTEDQEDFIEQVVHTAMHAIGERVARDHDTELMIGVALMRWGVFTIMGMDTNAQPDAFETREAEIEAAVARMHRAADIAGMLMLQVVDRVNGKHDPQPDRARALRLSFDDFKRAHAEHQHGDCAACVELSDLVNEVERVEAVLNTPTPAAAGWGYLVIAPLTSQQLSEMHSRAHRHTRDCYDEDNSALLLCARSEDGTLLLAEVERLMKQRDDFALTITELSMLRDAGGVSVSELARRHERMVAEVRALADEAERDFDERVDQFNVAGRLRAIADRAGKHWPDCALNHGGAACDMGPDCGSPDRSGKASA